jgi:hypothetical protein
LQEKTNQVDLVGPNLQDYLVTDRGITRNLTTDYSNLIQFPLAGQAMAIGYNLPELNATTDGGTLVPLPLPAS